MSVMINYTSSVTEMTDALKWGTLEDRRVEASLLILSKVFHNLTRIPMSTVNL